MNRNVNNKLLTIVGPSVHILSIDIVHSAYTSVVIPTII